MACQSYSIISYKCWTVMHRDYLCKPVFIYVPVCKAVTITNIIKRFKRHIQLTVISQYSLNGGLFFFMDIKLYYQWSFGYNCQMWSFHIAAKLRIPNCTKFWAFCYRKCHKAQDFQLYNFTQNTNPYKMAHVLGDTFFHMTRIWISLIIRWKGD